MKHLSTTGIFNLFAISSLMMGCNQSEPLDYTFSDPQEEVMLSAKETAILQYMEYSHPGEVSRNQNMPKLQPYISGQSRHLIFLL